MELVKKSIQQIELFDIYSKMLTEKQRKVFEDYYVFDMSLTELSQNYNTSKQAIEDLIKRTAKKLKDYEDNLEIYAKIKAIKNLKIADEDKQKILNILKK